MTIQKIWYKITHWEEWHYLAKYIPIAPVWLWYCIKGRSLWFFTPSNPTLTFGGFEGETKREMYDQLPEELYTATIYIDHKNTFTDVLYQLQQSGLQYPIAVKPDAGMMGFMFRKIRSEKELEEYHHKMPAEYLIQALVDYPLEVSVFYYRFPGEMKGTITGFIRKEFLQVTGDGRSTLDELIDAYPRASFRLDEVRSKHADRLHEIIPAGQPYILSYALNLSRGGRLVSLEHEKDDALLSVFDRISHHTKHLYYGRYDIKCRSIEALKRGEEFSILEYNGCGAEPHHIYGNGNSLFQAYAIVLKHWKVLYRISEINHQRGYKRWEHAKGKKFLKEAKAHFKILKRLDIATAV